MEFQKISSLDLKGLEKALNDACKITVFRSNPNSNYFIVRIERYHQLMVSSEATNVLLALKKANNCYLRTFEETSYYFSSKEDLPLDKCIKSGNWLELEGTRKGLHKGFFKGSLKTRSDEVLIFQVTETLSLLLEELNLKASRYSY